MKTANTAPRIPKSSSRTDDKFNRECNQKQMICEPTGDQVETDLQLFSSYFEIPVWLQ